MTAEFRIDGAQRPKRWTERLDREWRRFTVPKTLAVPVIRARAGQIAYLRRDLVP